MHEPNDNMAYPGWAMTSKQRIAYTYTLGESPPCTFFFCCFAALGLNMLKRLDLEERQEQLSKQDLLQFLFSVGLVSETENALQPPWPLP